MVGRPTDLNLFQMYYKMTKKRPCKKYSLAKFRTLKQIFRKHRKTNYGRHPIKSKIIWIKCASVAPFRRFCERNSLEKKHSLAACGLRNLVRVSLIFAIIVSFMLFNVFPLV